MKKLSLFLLCAVTWCLKAGDVNVIDSIKNFKTPLKLSFSFPSSDGAAGLEAQDDIELTCINTTPVNIKVIKFQQKDIAIERYKISTEAKKVKVESVDGFRVLQESESPAKVLSRLRQRLIDGDFVTLAPGERYVMRLNLKKYREDIASLPDGVKHALHIRMDNAVLDAAGSDEAQLIELFSRPLYFPMITMSDGKWSFFSKQKEAKKTQ
jgi:hypothetical protein